MKKIKTFRAGLFELNSKRLNLRFRATSIKIGVLLILAGVFAAPAVFGAYPDEYPIYLRMLGFSKDEIRFVQKGRMVTHSINDRSPGEYGIIAAQVYNVPIYYFRDFYRYIENYSTVMGFHQIGKFKSKPNLQDLRPLVLNRSELENFLSCRTAACDLRLSADEIKRIPETADLTTDSGQAEVGDLYRKILLDRLLEYKKSGIKSLSVPAAGAPPDYDPATLTSEHLYKFPELRAYFPILEKHILTYPAKNGKMTDEFFYWNKEYLGIHPVITLRHVYSQRVGEDYVQFNIMVYSSRYIASSIAVTHLINYVDSQYPRTLVVLEQRTMTDLYGNIVKALGRNILRANFEKRLTTSMQKIGRTMELRYHDNALYRNFPYGLNPRDQR